MTEQNEPVSGELEKMARAHFNEPMLCGFEIVRCIGYGEDDRDCYVIAQRPNPHADRIWISCVGGYTFLDRLKGQGYVKAYNGEDWDDLFRLDNMLTLNGAPCAPEFVLDLRPDEPESAIESEEDELDEDRRPDPLADDVAARIIANFCYLKGWSKAWESMTEDEQAEVIGLVETVKSREMVRNV